MIRCTLLIVVFAVFVGALAGQGIDLVADVRTQPYPDVGSDPRDLTLVGGDVYFVASTPDVGGELYRSRLGVLTPTLVADLYPGPLGSEPRALVDLGGRCCFGTARGKLMLTDGTAAGTIELADLGGQVQEAVVVGPLVFLAVLRDRDDGRLFVSDGTAAGTRQLGPATVMPRRLTPFRGGVVFAGVSLREGEEPWISDGTAQGTQMIADLYPGVGPLLIPHGSRPDGFFALGASGVVFDADDGIVSRGLYFTDGTFAGTRLVKDIRGSAGGAATRETERVGVGAHVYFGAPDPQGWALWRTDGTTPGTTRVRPVPASTHGITALRGVVYAMCCDAAAGMQYLVGFDPATSQSLAILNQRIAQPARDLSLWTDGQRLLFVGEDAATGRELWESDGVPSRTVMITDVQPGPGGSEPRELLTTLSGITLLVADDGRLGSELWGAVPFGSVQLQFNLRADPRATMSANVTDLSSHAGHLLFSASATQAFATHTFVSDGTGPGTVSVATGAGGAFQRGELGDEVFFAGTANLQPALLATDGTVAGTRVVHAGHPLQVGRLGDALVFATPRTAGVGLPLLRTGGRAAQVFFSFPARDVDPGIGPFARLGARLWFEYRDGTGATQLWSTDGTAAGTLQFDGSRTNPTFRQPRDPVAFGTLLLFAGEDAAAVPRLFLTDGTLAGTRQLRDANGRAPQGAGGSFELDGVLYFGASLGAAAPALWRTDGTVAGTSEVAAIHTGNEVPVFRHLRRFTRLGDELLFFADDGVHGLELWKSDGTGPGTVLVRDIAPGVASGCFDELTTFGARVYFTANDQVHGVELWSSDGTAAGTGMVEDLSPGPDDGYPAGLTWNRGRVYLSGFVPAIGRELFAVRVGAHAQRWGVGCAAGGTAPELDSSPPILGQTLELSARRLGTHGVGALLLGRPAPRVLPAGAACSLYVDVAGPSVVLPVRPVAGRWTLRVPVPANPALVGTNVGAQLGAGPSPQAPLGLDLSAGLWLVLGN